LQEDCKVVARRLQSSCKDFAELLQGLQRMIGIKENQSSMSYRESNKLMLRRENKKGSFHTRNKKK